eukprot:2443872-Pyramimonas_sp.AAC.1
MRQCQSGAHGADASRMTSCYFKTESASRSSSAQHAVLEMVNQGGLPQEHRARPRLQREGQGAHRAGRGGVLHDLRRDERAR